MEEATATADTGADPCLICLDVEPPPLDKSFPCGCRGPFHDPCLAVWFLEKEGVCPICRVCSCCGIVAQDPSTMQPLPPPPPAPEEQHPCVVACMFGVLVWLLLLVILYGAKVIS